MRIKDESVKNVDSFKHLVAISVATWTAAEDSNGKRAKEVFNRNRSIFCKHLEKELRKRLAKCFAWSVALCGAETSTLRRNEQKATGSI